MSSPAPGEEQPHELNCSVQGVIGLTGKGWRFWWTASRKWAISVTLQYRRLRVPWAALGVLPAGQRRGSCSSIQRWLCPLCTWCVVSISGLPSTRDIWTHKPSRGTLRTEWEQALMWICLTPAPRNEVGWGRIISATLTRLQALHPPEYHKNLTLFWQVPGHFIITHPL